MNVQQVLGAVGPFDAVTNQGLAFRRLFRSWGWGGEDVAEFVAPGMPRGTIRPARSLRPEPDDVILLHYSGYTPRLEGLLELPNRKMLLSHNVTPARYFWPFEPVEGVRCALAPGQLAEMALGADLAAGVSRFNAEDLRDFGVDSPEVIPVLFDRSRLGAPADPPTGPPTILFVGRLAPHKRQDLIIRAFALYRRERAPDARLVLVGNPISPRFGRMLRELADDLAPAAVQFESDVATERLWDHYRSAHAFLCLSEHEGFCVPLLEAFHFGVPVIAQPAGGIREVAGDAAILTSADDLAVIAELLHLAVTDQELRTQLRRRGEPRLETYSYDRTAARLRDALERVAAG